VSRRGWSWVALALCVAACATEPMPLTPFIGDSTSERLYLDGAPVAAVRGKESAMVVAARQAGHGLAVHLWCRNGSRYPLDLLPGSVTVTAFDRQNAGHALVREDRAPWPVSRRPEPVLAGLAGIWFSRGAPGTSADPARAHAGRDEGSVAPLWGTTIFPGESVEGTLVYHRADAVRYLVSVRVGTESLVAVFVPEGVGINADGNR